MVDGWKAVGHRHVSESGIRFGHQFYAKISYTISLLCGITGEHGSHKHKHLISRPKYSARFWEKLKYKVLSSTTYIWDGKSLTPPSSSSSSDILRNVQQRIDYKHKFIVCNTIGRRCCCTSLYEFTGLSTNLRG